MKLCARVSSLYSCDCLHSTQLFIYFFIKKKIFEEKKKRLHISFYHTSWDLGLVAFVYFLSFCSGCLPDVQHRLPSVGKMNLFIASEDRKYLTRNLELTYRCGIILIHFGS